MFCCYQTISLTVQLMWTPLPATNNTAMFPLREITTVSIRISLLLVSRCEIDCRSFMSTIHRDQFWIESSQHAKNYFWRLNLCSKCTKCIILCKITKRFNSRDIHRLLVNNVIIPKNMTIATVVNKYNINEVTVDIVGMVIIIKWLQQSWYVLRSS